MEAQYEAFNRHDLDEMRTRIAEDFIWRPNPEDLDQQVASGWQETEARMRDLWEFLPELRSEVEAMEEDGERVLASVRHFARSSASETVFDRREVQVWTIRNGKIVELQEFPDLDSARAGLEL